MWNLMLTGMISFWIWKRRRHCVSLMNVWENDDKVGLYRELWIITAESDANSRLFRMNFVGRNIYLFHCVFANISLCV